MYKYRLTRRGKIVITVFTIILFSATGALSMGMMARAQNNGEDAYLSKAADIHGRGFAYTDSRGIGYTDDSANVEDESIECRDESSGGDEASYADYAHIESRKEDILSIDAEDAYEYEEKKVAFLTFDDGPSKKITPQVLDILKKYNVKATFFVLGSLSEKNSAILKDIANCGHAIGIHTYTHNYKLIYKSPENFTDEIRRTDDVLKKTLGEEFHTRLFRFPGGSFEGYKRRYRDILSDYGYVSIDWNAINGDGEASGLPPQKLLDRLKATSKGKGNLVVLMHDSSGKQTTVDVLPDIIEYLKSQEYEFAVLR